MVPKGISDECIKTVQKGKGKNMDMFEQMQYIITMTRCFDLLEENTEKTFQVMKEDWESNDAFNRIQNWIGKSESLEKDIRQDLESWKEKTHLNKQINSIPFPDVKNELQQRIQRRDKIVIDDVMKLLNIVIKEGWSIGVVKLLSKYVATLLMEYMDIYLLARIFKSREYNNIIIYVGDAHAEYYREFLARMGLPVYKETRSSDDYVTCIDVQKFIPFF
jgi:hypothetical protein